MTKLSYTLFIFSAAIMLATLVGSAMAQDYEAARVIAAATQKAIAAGEWEKAEQQLNDGRSACSEKEAGKTCRLLLEFNLGYLMERRSRADLPRREEFLERSLAAYRRVLADAPGHEATLNNLALVLSDLGRVGELENLFQQTKQTMPAQSGAIALLIGELESSKERWQEAFDAYRQAARLLPRNDTAPRKMVEIYGHLPQDRQEGFSALVREWEFRFPAVAEEGYRAVVRHRARDSGLQAERAMLRWVMVTSELRTISAVKIREDFADIDYGPARELAVFLERLEKAESGLFRSADDVSYFIQNGPRDGYFGWWTATPERRDAIGFAALAAGRAAVVEQRPEQAQRRWIFGLWYAPEIEQYVFGQLRKQTFVPLELITELAWLQFRYPDLDPQERKFKLFIDLLFRGKGQAYEAGDLRAIQRHHTVLGEIFAAKGVWRSNWADNAIFQLSHAINTAKRREKQEDLYQPMPGLKARLAEGYTIVGKTDEARQTAVDAAQAYLDTDQLDRAVEMLARARASEAPRAERNRIEALRDILEGRQAIRERLEAVKRERPLKTEVPELRWLTVDRIPGLSDDFLLRQQFKANSDLAEIAARENRSSQAKDRAGVALARAEKLSTLVGASDMLRLERVASLVGAGDKRRPQTRQVEVLYGLDRPTGMTDAWLLSLPTTQGLVYIGLTTP